MQDIIVVDNVIPVDYQNHLATVMTSLDFPWVFNNYMVSGDSDFKNDPNNHSGFNHFFYEKRTPTSNFFQLLYPLVLSITSQTGLSFNQLIRMRANLTLCNPGSTQDHHMPHIDSFYPHWNAIYYVNDTDGDTVIFNETNETYDSGQEDVLKIKEGVFTIKQRITPKQGRLVAFPGKYYHSSSPVRSNRYRCVINMNLGKVL